MHVQKLSVVPLAGNRNIGQLFHRILPAVKGAERLNRDGRGGSVAVSLGNPLACLPCDEADVTFLQLDAIRETE